MAYASVQGMVAAWVDEFGLSNHVGRGDLGDLAEKISEVIDRAAHGGVDAALKFICHDESGSHRRGETTVYTKNERVALAQESLVEFVRRYQAAKRDGKYGYAKCIELDVINAAIVFCDLLGAEQAARDREASP